MKKKIGILVPVNPNDKPDEPYEKAKLHGLLVALESKDFTVLQFFYSNEKFQEIERELEKLDMVLVWINPIEQGQSRSVLNAMLKRLSDKNIHVSTHPDIIAKIGTKEVLFRTKGLVWGSDVKAFKTRAELKTGLLKGLKPSVSRVLKQNRGNGGLGVWRIELTRDNPNKRDNPYVKVLSAIRDSKEEEILLETFLDRITGYFDNDGLVMDQEYIAPEPNGMLRCYMTQNKVVGFGHQYVKNLLRQTTDGKQPTSKPRLYYPKEKEEYQDIRKLLEEKWIKDIQNVLDIKTKELPILWDADFLYREQPKSTDQKYVLCEINVSSVYPFPETAVPDIVEQIKKILEEKN